MQATDLILEILSEYSKQNMVVDNTEIIFEPSLQLNPLALLQTVGRRFSLIWSIPGHIEGNRIVYAYPGHPEHQKLPVSEFQVWKM